jgi:pimeloyl-ACP methyl ester carboxylesterase
MRFCTLLTLAALACSAVACAASDVEPEASDMAATTEAGVLVDFKPLTTLSREQIDGLKKQAMPTAQIPAARNGVKVFKVTYTTPNLANEPSKATGVVIVPDTTNGPSPLLSYQHATMYHRRDVASEGQGELLPAIVLYGALGYVVSAADYLGLGDSPGLHPYDHAETEARASTDMLRATREIAQKENIPLSSQLFLAGYSQGGHATMALHRYLERDLANEFPITASAPSAGSYDLSSSAVKALLKTPGVLSPALAAYVFVAMHEIYAGARKHEVPSMPSLSDIFQPELVGKVRATIDGDHHIADVMAALPDHPDKLLKPEFKAALFGDDGDTNPKNPMIRALATNNVYDWKPIAPLRLCHGGGDVDSSFHNSEMAAKRMKELGAKNVELVLIGNLSHRDATIPCQEQSVAFFESFRNRR